MSAFDDPNVKFSYKVIDSMVGSWEICNTCLGAPGKLRGGKISKGRMQIEMYADQQYDFYIERSRNTI